MTRTEKLQEQVILDLGEILLDAKADKDKIPIAIRRVLNILEVKAPDQSLPNNMNKDNIKYNDDYTTGYLKGQQYMLTPNNGTVFMKVLVKEEKDG